MHDAWNSWIVGGVLAIASLVEMNTSMRSAANWSWLSMLLSIWAFFSPWIFSYSPEMGRFINSLCVGVVSFALAVIISVMASRTGSRTVAHRP